MEKIPNGFRGLRFIGDVHGHFELFSKAVQEAQDLGFYVVQLGDLIDRGPNSPGCMQLGMQLVASGQGVVLPGNHDYKLARYVLGQKVGRVAQDGFDSTLQQLDARPDGKALAQAFSQMVFAAPMWVRFGQYLAAHAAWSYRMDLIEAPTLSSRQGKDLTLVLYGETDGTMEPDTGLPTRSYGWVDFIGTGTTMVVGHDVRGAAPLRVKSWRGGEVVFLDTGCGKGGPLSVLDVEDIGALPWV